MLLLFLFLCLGSGGRWVVDLKEGVDAHQFALQHGVEYMGTVMDRRYHLFNDPVSHADRTLHGPLFTRDTPDIVWAEEQVRRHRFTRPEVVSTSSDPLYEQQWHLHGDSPSSIDVDQVSNYTGGRGIVIAIVDDGLQWNHPDLRANYDARHSYNYNSGNSDTDPSPRSSQNGHGTSAAGVAGAVRHNGVCGHGVAFAAKIAGLRLIAEPVDDATESTALSAFSTAVHIYSNSWGPADDSRNMEAPGRLVRETFARFTGEGRGRSGKGLIYTWASGNGRDVGDHCAFDGYAGNPYVNAIGAVDVSGRQSWYSEGCSNLMAVTPSSGQSTGITTVDLVGAAGYSPTNCTSTFGGTSSAAPLAAGIIALLLERRPELTWRDVKHVIAKGATKVDPTHREWNTNAAGYHHSNAYGFGLLKVPLLLETLEKHQLVPPHQIQVFSDEIRPHNDTIAIIQSQGDGGSNYTFTISGTLNITFIEMVILTISLQHPSRGSVSINVYSPSKTKSVIIPYRLGDNNADYPRDGWSISSLHFWGESNATGEWILQIQERVATHSGKLIWARVGVWGY